MTMSQSVDDRRQGDIGVNWDALGAISDFVGALAVIVSFDDCY